MRYIDCLIFVFCSVVSTMVCAASEMEERRSISGSARAAFLQEEFDSLEGTARNFLTTKSRTSSGLWKLTLFHAGIGDGIDAFARSSERESAFRLAHEKLSRWEKQYPKSPNPYIARSLVHISHAWAYRGGGYASTVKPEDWGPFYKFISLARQTLEASKPVASADPRWYEVMLTVARAQGWERNEFDRLLVEALEKEPAFYQTYFLALEYLLPKWHGGAREIEEFARDAVKRTAKQEGQGLYARIYWFASQTQYGNKLFTESRVAWPNMKNGFEDVIARYPDAWNVNNYAKFACLARDKPKTLQLLNKVQSAAVPEAWEPPELLKKCASWARQ